LRVRGRGWGNPFRTTGKKAWHSVYSEQSFVGVVETCCCIPTRIALSYLGVGVVAPVAVVVEGIAHIVVAGTVVVVPK
jgi:hypothetical protein